MAHVKLDSPVKVFVVFVALDSLEQLAMKVIETAAKSTNLVKEKTVCTPSNLTTCLPLMSFVTKQQPVGGGQCSRRD